MAAQPRRILVGYDGSEALQRALDAAAELVGYGATLSLVQFDPPTLRTVESSSVHASIS